MEKILLKRSNLYLLRRIGLTLLGGMVFLGRTGRLMPLKVSLAQNFFCFKISKASVPEAHTRVRNTGRISRKEQEKDDDRLPRASGERWKRNVSKTRACIINIIRYPKIAMYAVSLERFSTKRLE